MIKQEIIHELMKRLGLSRIGVYKRIEKTQNDLKIMDLEVAAYCLAFQNGIKIKRYNIDENTLKKVEDALRSQNSTSNPKPKKKSTKIGEQNIIMQIGGNLKLDHPILPKKMVTEAKKMADIYPIIYVFENSVRRLIQHIMELKYGDDWWEKASIPSKVKEKVKIRRNDEDKNKWHSKRGSHEIFYTDIEELTSIIENNWNEFVAFLPKQHWVKTMIEIIGTSRNVVAHNNPLSDDDIDALKVHFKQWTKQIKDIFHHVQN